MGRRPAPAPPTSRRACCAVCETSAEQRQRTVHVITFFHEPSPTKPGTVRVSMSAAIFLFAAAAPCTLFFFSRPPPLSSARRQRYCRGGVELRNAMLLTRATVPPDAAARRRPSLRRQDVARSSQTAVHSTPRRCYVMFFVISRCCRRARTPACPHADCCRCHVAVRYR